MEFNQNKEREDNTSVEVEDVSQPGPSEDGKRTSAITDVDPMMIFQSDEHVEDGEDIKELTEEDVICCFTVEDFEYIEARTKALCEEVIKKRDRQLLDEMEYENKHDEDIEDGEA